MKSHFCIAFLFSVFVLSACTTSVIPTPTIQTAPMPTISPTATFPKTPSLALTRSVTPTATPLPPTATVTVVESPSVTSIPITDPRLDELEKEGYVQMPGARQLNDGDYVYLQYVKYTEEKGNCHLIFARRDDAQYNLIADFDASQLSSRIQDVVTQGSDIYGATIMCSPQSWGDVNKNYKPDIPVEFWWGNQYTGSELHIFELVDREHVVALTKELPGIISPWNFDPDFTWQMVIDVVWAKHDCIYPPMYIFWIYDWQGDKYVDVTAQQDFSDYIAERKARIAERHGDFNPYHDIEPLTQLLLIYDRTGQRDKGWQEYLALTDVSRWANTDEWALEILKSDIEHFSREYQAGQPFTPNDNCFDQ